MKTTDKNNILTNIFKIPILRNFFIGSLVFAAAVPLLNVFYIYPSFNKVLIEITQDEASRTTKHLIKMLIKNELKAESVSDEMKQEVKIIKDDFQLEKLKIFSYSGKVVYSTDPKDIGVMNQNEYFRNIVAKGGPYSKLVQKNTKSAEDQIIQVDMIESYIPVMKEGVFWGALEIYYDITQKKAELDKQLYKAAAIVIATSSTLFFAFIIILFNASRANIERNRSDEQLKGFYEDLEKRIGERTADLNKSNKALQLEMAKHAQSEKKVHQSEERYRGLIETSIDAIISADETGKIIQWNNAASKIFGYIKEEAIGQPITLLDPDRFKNANIDGFNRILETGSKQISGKTLTSEGRKKDGTIVPIELSVSAFQGDSSWLFTSIIRDITERNRAQFELIRSHDTQAVIKTLLSKSLSDLPITSILEQSLDLILSIPWLTFESKGCIYLVEKEPDILVMKTQQGIQEELLTKCRKVPFGTCLCGRSALTREVVFANRIDDHHDIRFEGMTEHGHYCVPILHGDRVLGIVNIYLKEGHRRDEREIEFLTSVANTLAGILIRRYTEEEKRKIENQLRQSQKMEAVGTMAGGIAHDFNNILTSIIGYCELALDVAEKGSMLEDNIKEVLTAGNRAKDLVRQILAFSRQGSQEVKPVMPSLIVKEAIKLLRSATPTTIDVKQNITSDSLIMGDQTQIHQVLMNLCTNAVHAMESSGGILTVNLSDVQLDDSFTGQYEDLTPGNYLKLSVSDTGKGISSNIIESIFEPYFTTKKPGEGTGLGLSVVHGIVKGFNGEITVTSEPGSGSTFTVYLPILKKSVASKSDSVELLPVGKERILLVDDEASIVNMCKQILTRLGYNVTTRTSSIEALELFKNRPGDFDLVLTDMTMPNMTGDKLAAALIQIRPDIPVILCTGYSKKISDERAAEIGIKAFVMKPFVRIELAKIIRKVFDNQEN